MLDYPALQLIWWILLGVLLIGFAVLDGFDMGVAILLPFLGRTDMERRLIINTIGPVWESNQVWLILGAGAIFAAWPLLYAVAFSCLYLPMFVILTALIVRPVAFKFRSKLHSLKWRTFWDRCLFMSGAAPALLFGIVIGNVLQGIPFRFDAEMRIFYEGSFFQLLNPYTLGWGFLSLFLVINQGIAYLMMKAEPVIAKRAHSLLKGFLMSALVLFTILFVEMHSSLKGYHLISHKSLLIKEVIQKKRAWAFPSSFLWVPLLAYLGGFGALITKRPGVIFLLSSAMIAGIMMTVGVSLYPFLLPSSLSFVSSLTLFDAASSQYTLWIMFLSVLIFLPIVLIYVSWMYRVFRGRVRAEDIHETSY